MKDVGVGNKLVGHGSRSRIGFPLFLFVTGYTERMNGTDMAPGVVTT